MAHSNLCYYWLCHGVILDSCSVYSSECQGVAPWEVYMWEVRECVFLSDFIPGAT